MSEIGIEDLPNELLQIILSVFSAESLGSVVAKVCSRWKDLSEVTLQRRTPKIRNTLDEIETKFLGSVSDLVLHKEYESTFMRSDYRLKDYEASFYKYPCARRLTWCISAFCERIKSIVEDQPDEIQLTFPKIVFIECHDLMVMVVHKEKKVVFYNQAAFFEPHKNPHPDFIPYLGTYSVESVEPTDGVACFDVYHDNLAVVLKDATIVVLYQITNVCHAKPKRKLLLNLVRKIQFHTSIHAITLFKDKIYTVFDSKASLSVGMWQQASSSGGSEVRASEREFPEDVDKLQDDNYGPMCRVNNLLFIRLSKKSVDVENEETRSLTAWMMLDMNEASLDFLEVAVGDIFGSNVTAMRLLGNILLIHRTFGQSFSQDALMVKVKSDPTRQHFLNPTKFKQLADLSSIMSTTKLNTSNPFIVAVPSSWNCLAGTKTVFLVTDKHEYQGTVKVTTIGLYNKEERPGPYISILEKPGQSSSTLESSWLKLELA